MCILIVKSDQGSTTKSQFSLLKISPDALNISLKDGEKYRATWLTQCRDVECIWKESGFLINTKSSNLIDDCQISFVVICKILLPMSRNSRNVNCLAIYALYKILKRFKVNPVHLIWEGLMEFLQGKDGRLPFGSLICTVFYKKGLLIPYVENVPLLDDDIV